MNTQYDDIIHLPHHVSKTRPQMSMLDRAAQFSPFAALTGYEDAIQETGRLTDERMELSDEDRELLDRKWHYLQEIISDRPEITVCNIEGRGNYENRVVEFEWTDRKHEKRCH